MNEIKLTLLFKLGKSLRRLISKIIICAPRASLIIGRNIHQKAYSAYTTAFSRTITRMYANFIPLMYPPICGVWCINLVVNERHYEENEGNAKQVL